MASKPFGGLLGPSAGTAGQGLLFGAAPHGLLADLLINLNGKNEESLRTMSQHSGSFKEQRLVECVFLMCEELRLDHFTGYQALEILERYMIKHLEYLLDPNTEPGAAGGQPGDLQGSVLVKLRDRFMLTVFSCIQLASKLALHCHIIDNNVGVSFLQSMGYNYTKETLLESELHILKTLDFCISIPNPLTYVEMLLEVLGYNDSSVPVPQMHTVCQQVLQFIYLQRNAIYHHLLQAVTACPSPTVEQRVKFVTVKEDSMLLAIGVIAVGAFILRFTSWEQVVDELSCITGASGENIADFTYVVLNKIVGDETPMRPL